MRIFRVTGVSMTDEINDNNQPQKIFSGLGLLGEEVYKRSMFQEAGFTRFMKEDDVVVCIEDEVSGTVTAIATESDDRPLLSVEGDVAMYSSEDIFIKVLASGQVLIDNGSGTIELDTNGQVKLNGTNLTVDP